MPLAIRPHQTFHFDTADLGRTALLAINAMTLGLIVLLLSGAAIRPELSWMHQENLFAALMLVGLALIPASLLLSAYFAQGDPLVCPVCKIVAAYNLIVAVFLFAHIASAADIDRLDLTFSTMIGIVAILNTFALLARLKQQS